MIHICDACMQLFRCVCTCNSNTCGGVVIFLEKRTVAKKIMFLKQFGQAHKISVAEEPSAVSAYDLAHEQPRAPRPHEQAGLPSQCGRAGNDQDKHATVYVGRFCKPNFGNFDGNGPWPGARVEK